MRLENAPTILAGDTDTVSLISSIGIVGSTGSTSLLLIID
jgi:hypothetical protein